MKALQLLPALDEGGVERHVLQLNRILVADGWENVVVSRGGRLVGELERDGARHVTAEMKSKNPLTVPLRVARLRKILRAEKPDVVCAHSRVPAWLFTFASRGLSLPWITFAHGANSVSRYSRVMATGDRVMCPSTFVADHLRNAYGGPSHRENLPSSPPLEERIRVVPHAVDAARFDPAAVGPAEVAKRRAAWKPDGRHVVMSVGRITRLKGFGTLIRALKALGPGEFKLVIVGDAEKGKEPLLAELKALASSLGLDEAVVFAGGEENVPAALALADVVVSGNTAKPESFGLSMAEALAMGKPVVATAFGGALDVVRDGTDGILVPPGVPDPAAAYAEAIRRVRAHGPWTGLREGVTSRFSVARNATDTLAVYREVAALR